MSHLLTDYAYDFPAELIALYPTAERSASRLMILDRQTRAIEHRSFANILDHFGSGDVLVLNNSKVFPCRLVTQRASGGRQEILLLEKVRAEAQGEVWRVMINASRKLHRHDRFDFENLSITILDDAGNTRQALLEFNGELKNILDRIADIPLPPYIQRANEPIDKTRYQTVFAKTEGSVAAPTAGLHFTPEIFSALKDKGVHVTEVTLHVGPGTFLPVRTDDITKHQMHAEHFTISEETCQLINTAKATGHKVTAVGTTSVRVLESIARRQNHLTPQTTTTDIFIYPPYDFKIVDRLITNFHQPESTLLMLVGAFANRNLVLTAYQDAIQKQYRLFSYGDAMLIL